MIYHGGTLPKTEEPGMSWVLSIIVQMNPEILTAYCESERVIIVGRPLWATIGFGLAVFGGELGSIFLLLKKSIAIYLFIVSLLGVFVSMLHMLRIFDPIINFSSAELVGIILMTLVVAEFLIWYTK